MLLFVLNKGDILHSTARDNNNVLQDDLPVNEFLTLTIPLLGLTILNVRHYVSPI